MPFVADLNFDHRAAVPQPRCRGEAPQKVRARGLRASAPLPLGRQTLGPLDPWGDGHTRGQKKFV